MRKEDNLKKGNPETQFNARTAVEAGRKGGKKTAEKRQKHKTMVEELKALLEARYKDELTGEERTGSENLMVNLMNIALDPKNRLCLQAMKMIMDMTGDSMTTEQMKENEAKLELIKAQVEYTKKKTENADWT